MPLLFCVILIFVSISGFRQAMAKGQSPLPFMIVPLVMFGMMYWMFRRFLLDLVDEVRDMGDALLVRKKDIEETIKLSNIVNVQDMTGANWPRVTLTLREPCRLGREVSFSPVGSRGFGKLSSVAIDLIARIDAQRGA
jgi:hypothetical protein